MRIKLTIITFLFTVFTAGALEFDIQEINLPGEDLVVHDIYAINGTILARAWNTIYKSTDDGTSWYKTLESETKINKLKAVDGHRIFVVGDNGLVLRSMDYGETWIDFSIEGDSKIIDISCNEIKDLFAITPNRLVYHSPYSGLKWNAYDTGIDVGLDFVQFANGNYRFGGDNYKSGETQKVGSGTWDYKSLPLFKFINSNLVQSVIFRDATYHNFNLRPFIIDSKYCFTFFNSYHNTEGHENYLSLSLGQDIFMLRNGSYQYASYKSAQTEPVEIFTAHNNFIILDQISNVQFRHIDTLTNHLENRIPVYKFKFKKEKLNLSKLYSGNSDNDAVYAGSDSSRIYKINVIETPLISSIREDARKYYNQYQNTLIIDKSITKTEIYDYMGRRVYSGEIRNLELESGIYFIVLKHRNGVVKDKVLIQ